MFAKKRRTYGVLFIFLTVVFITIFSMVGCTPKKEEEKEVVVSSYAAGQQDDINRIILSSPDKDLFLFIPEQAVEEELEKEGEEEEDEERIKTERDVAEFFAEYVEKITGRAATIVEGDIAASIADHAQSNIVLRLICDEDAPYGSFVLRAGKDADQSPSEDKNFYIEGYDVRGLVNGVYAYLRAFCGVNIYSAKVRTVPEMSEIFVTDGYYHFYKPLLEYADTDWISPHDLDFATANGLNGSYSPANIAGGIVNYITFCHSLSNSIVPASRDYKTHPEYFALSEEGKRMPTQLCLSNPDVIETAKRDVLDLIEEKYDENACLNIISVTQDDNQQYCHCAQCQKIADTFGGQSGIMIWFVNQIADEVAASDYPDVVVDTFAYQYTRQAPMGIQPRKNVCVRLCTIECCFAHPLDDGSCEQNKEFMSDLADWSEICSRLYIWDYTTNYAQTIGIFPDFGVIRQNIDTFISHSVVGIYEEGAYYAADCNAEFADLRSYLLARYMYDPFDTYGSLEGSRDGFLKAYYGEGWEEVGRFLDYVTEHAGDEEGHLYIGSSMEKTLHDVSDEDVIMIDAWWTEAENKAADAKNVGAVARIKRSRICWEYYKACTQRGEYRHDLSVHRWKNAMQKLIDSLHKYGVTRYNEGNTMKKILTAWYVEPSRWGLADVKNVYVTSFVLSVIGIALCIAVVVLALKKKKYGFLVLPPAFVIATVLSDFATVTFATDEHTVLFCILALLICFCAGFFLPAAVYALRKDEKSSVLRSVLAWLISSVSLAVLLFLGTVLFAQWAFPKAAESAYLSAYFVCQGAMTIGLLTPVVKTVAEFIIRKNAGKK